MQNLYQNRLILTRKDPGGALVASYQAQDCLPQGLQLGRIFEWQVIMASQVENIFSTAADGGDSGVVETNAGKGKCSADF